MDAFNDNKINIDTFVLLPPLSFVRGGKYSDIYKTIGYYWLNFFSNTTRSHFLSFYTNSLRSQNGDNRGHGYALRCLAR